MEAILNILNNKLFQILLRNNFVFNNAIPEFKYGKEEKILWNEFVEATEEFPQLLEPGLTALGALDMVIDVNNVPDKVQKIIFEVKNHQVPKEQYRFENPKNLLQLYEIYCEDLKDKTRPNIRYDIHKNLGYYGIVNLNTNIKKTEVLPENLIVDVLCINDFFDDNVYFEKTLTWINLNKNLIRQDLLLKNLNELNDENKKVACAVLEKAGGNTFKKLTEKLKNKFKKNITYQKNKADTIRANGLDDIFCKYGIIAAKTNIELKDDVRRKMMGYYQWNKVLANRLQIGPNPRADFFALKELNKDMAIKDIIKVAKIQKSTATKFNHDFKLLHAQ